MNTSAARQGRKTIALAASVMLGATALLGLGAAQSDSIEPRTLRYSTLAACNTAKAQYSTSFTRVVSGCTYVGRYLFGIKLDSGPYQFVYAVRS